jgi:hypothetical protein
MTKICKYGCGIEIIWSDDMKFWADARTGELHDYKRCAEIQKANGNKPFFFDKVKDKK